MKQKIRTKIISLILFLKRYKAKEGIIIFGDPRGGSTWLMEILSVIPKTCINWEPLHKTNGVVPKEYNFGDRPFIPPDDKNKQYFELFKNILSLKHHTLWTTRYLRQLKIKDILHSKIIITKFIRANNLIPYLVKNYEFNNKPILLIRHPIDVCMSQIKAFGKTTNKYVMPKCLNNDRFIEHLEFLEQLDNEFEIHIAKWCLNNMILLNNSKGLKQISSKVSVVFYSDLLLNPEEETLIILKSINGISLVEAQKMVAEINFKKPSKTDFKQDFKTSTEEQLNKNFNLLSMEDKIKIQKIFDYFDFKIYDAFSPYPNKTSLCNG